MGFWAFFSDLGVLFEVQNGSKIMKMHSRNALRFPTSFRNRFSKISAQFSRSPNLKNRAPAYTGTPFPKNRRFRFRTSFWTDFWWFYLRFGPQKSTKTPPKTLSKHIDFFIAVFLRFGPLWGPFGEPFWRRKSLFFDLLTMISCEQELCFASWVLFAALGCSRDRFRWISDRFLDDSDCSFTDTSLRKSCRNMSKTFHIKIHPASAVNKRSAAVFGAKRLLQK